LADRHDVIGVGLTMIVAHASTRPARPRVPRQHRLPPRPVGLVAVAPGRGARAVAVVPPRADPRRPVCWDTCGHQLLNRTVALAVTPAAAATSFT
jgi:hypothetical protein